MTDNDSNTNADVSNAQVAEMLREHAQLLQRQGESNYRVAAYRRAAATVARRAEPLAHLYERAGLAGLEKLPGIGKSLGRKIAEFLRLGRSRSLERLRRRHAAGDLLTTLPGVGRGLAQRLRQRLGSDSLEAVFRAARDGRLTRIDGFGRKRVQAIRESLAARLPDDKGADSTASKLAEPAVAELLWLDEQYRALAAEGRLPRARPRQFNPTAVAWLPVWRTERSDRRYSVHFANSARSHQLGAVYDWVVIVCETKAWQGQWTVVTQARGPLAGRRVVRGRERECIAHYRVAPKVQRRLPVLDDD